MRIYIFTVEKAYGIVKFVGVLGFQVKALGRSVAAPVFEAIMRMRDNTMLGINMRKLGFFLSRARWQFMISAFVAFAFGISIICFQPAHNRMAILDISTYVSFISGLASIVALFCSVSFGFVLFQIQSSKTERLTTYSEFKSRLQAFQAWLFSLEDNDDKDTCLAMVFELEKLDVSDIPQTDYGEEYNNYVNSLERGLADPDRRQFYLTSALYSGYIEQLLARLGVISIRQIITKRYLDTLSKGFSLVGCLVILLFIASLTFGPTAKPYLLVAAMFFCSATLLLFVEFAFDVYRQYEEDLDFIDAGER